MQPVGTKPNNSTDKILSSSLDLLRFPMITIVVLIHTNFAVQPAYMENLAVNNCDAGIANGIMYYIIGFLAWVSTPVFYTMSGYLFFYKTGDFDKTVYIKKNQSQDTFLVNPLYYLEFVIPYNLINSATYRAGLDKQQQAHRHERDEMALGILGHVKDKPRQCSRSYRWSVILHKGNNGHVHIFPAFLFRIEKQENGNLRLGNIDVLVLV